RFSLPLLQARDNSTRRASKRFSFIKLLAKPEEKETRKAEAIEEKKKALWRKCGHDNRIRRKGASCEAPEGLCHWQYFDGSEEEKRRTLEHCSGCERDLCWACIANGQC